MIMLLRVLCLLSPTLLTALLLATCAKESAGRRGPASGRKTPAAEPDKPVNKGSKEVSTKTAKENGKDGSKEATKEASNQVGKPVKRSEASVSKVGNNNSWKLVRVRPPTTTTSTWRTTTPAR